jgi:uncharacterized protein YxeA
MKGIHLVFLLVMLMVLGTIWYEISQKKFSSQGNSALSQNNTYKNLTIQAQNQTVYAGNQTVYEGPEKRIPA